MAAQPSSKVIVQKSPSHLTRSERRLGTSTPRPERGLTSQNGVQTCVDPDETLSTSRWSGRGEGVLYTLCGFRPTERCCCFHVCEDLVTSCHRAVSGRTLIPAHACDCHRRGHFWCAVTSWETARRMRSVVTWFFLHLHHTLNNNRERTCFSKGWRGQGKVELFVVPAPEVPPVVPPKRVL